MPKISPMGYGGDGASAGPVLGRREVYFRIGGELKRFATTYYDRARLAADARLDGPAVIFQVDSTTVVPPGWSVRNEPSGDLLLAKRPRRRSPNGNRSR